MTKLPLVSIAVLNWNGKRFIDPFFKSLLKQTYPLNRMQVLFIDNGSSDDSIAYVEGTYSSKVSTKIVANGDNYGYAGGNNRGLKHADGDYILVINNDIEMHKDLIKHLVDSAKKTNSAATVPKLMFLNKHGKINNAGSMLEPTKTWPVVERGYGEDDKGQFDIPTEITAFCGACVLYTREFLQTVGMYDSRFFMYFEDSDLSWRGQSAGSKYYYEPSAVAYHVHTGSSKEGSPLFNFYVGRNRMLILAKNAKFRVLLRGMAETYYWHLIFRIGMLFKAALGKAPKRHSLTEFWRSQKMLFSLWVNLPNAFAKRWGFVGEEKL